MAFDCYCAVCGVGFAGLRIGSLSDTTAERRKEYVERISRSLGRAGETTSSGDNEPILTYDPRLVDQENLSWTSQVHCLGMEEDDKRKKKAFISGPGYYADAGELAVKVGQTARRTYFNCYGVGSNEAPGPVVPFHWCCFEILLRTLTGTTDLKNVNLDTLYDAMMSQCNTTGSALRLPYGDDVARAQGQYWQSLPGAEYTVRHPTNTPGLEQFLQTQIQTNNKLRTPSRDLNLGTRHPKNPFGRLPAELVYQICSFLPGDSLNSLTQASLHVNLLTRDDYFWRKFIQSDMPWLWETSSILRKPNDLLPSDLNYHLLYQFLTSVTAQTYGMDDAEVMGVANRRRIWGACEVVQRRYDEVLVR
ncbi:F-box domain protein [Aspergillus californicus]